MEKSGVGRMMDGLMNGIDRDTEISVERRGIEFIRFFSLKTLQNEAREEEVFRTNWTPQATTENYRLPLQIQFQTVVFEY